MQNENNLDKRKVLDEIDWLISGVNIVHTLNAGLCEFITAPLYKLKERVYSGSLDAEPAGKPCEVCGGGGRIPQQTEDAIKNPWGGDCPSCHGSGKVG